MNGYIYKAQVEQFLTTATFEEALARYEELEEAYRPLSDAFNAFLAQYPRGPMNLTPDFVRAMPEYQTLRSAADHANERTKIFAAASTKKFKKEYRAHIIARREAKLKASQEQQT